MAPLSHRLADRAPLCGTAGAPRPAAPGPSAQPGRRRRRQPQPSVAAGVSLEGDAVPAASAAYVPGPVEVGPGVYIGAAACLLVFLVGAWEFAKRIVIQQRCETCGGSGLVSSRSGNRLRKCATCGGFFPWLGWKTFFTSTAAPGNGGPLLQPRGQTSVFYRVPERRKPGQERGAEAKGGEGQAVTGDRGGGQNS